MRTDVSPAANVPVTDSDDSPFGDYELLEEIARGGMGIVYKARQKKLNRTVALKMIKSAELAGEEEIQRFHAEAEAAAKLDHPNIVPIYEVGEQNGRQFFSMGYVEGSSLAETLKKSPLPPRGAAELIKTIAEGVQYAHDKGIVHRDLKPSNVLMESNVKDSIHENAPVDPVSASERALHDARPRISDFGLAKNISADNDMTATGQILGTPSYMPPEQAAGEIEHIGPRSDVYSLGAMLYAMVTGRPPFQAANVMETLKQVLEREPVSPAQLNTSVDKDLETICLKCLEKEPQNRYQTASAFIDDVERYLAGRPVLARPISRAGRMWRWCKRNRTVAAIGLLSLILLVALAIGGPLMAIQQSRLFQTAEVERKNAEQSADAERTAKKLAQQSETGERIAKLKAQKRLAQIERSNDILASIFTDLDIETVKLGKDPLEAVLAKRLVKAAKELEGDSIGEPLVVAKMQSRLARALLNLSYPSSAISLLEKCIATRSAELGEDHLQTLKAANDLAEALYEAGQARKSLQLSQKTLKFAKATLGPDHPETLLSVHNLANAYQEVGQRDKALPMLEALCTQYKSRFGTAHPKTLLSMVGLAEAYREAGQYGKALPLLERIYKMRQLWHGPEHPTTLNSLNNLAVGYKAAGQVKQALPLLEKALNLKKTTMGADHLSTLSSMMNLGDAYRQVGDLKKSIPILDAARNMLKTKYGSDHTSTLKSMALLGIAYNTSRKFEKSVPLLEETLRRMKSMRGAEHPDTVSCLGYLIMAYQESGQSKSALPLLEEKLRIEKLRLGTDNRNTLRSILSLAIAYKNAGDLSKALPLFEEARRRSASSFGVDDKDTLNNMAHLAVAYEAAGRLRQALPLYEDALRRQRTRLGDGDPGTLNTATHLIGAYLSIRKFDKAQSLLQETLRQTRVRLGADHSKTLDLTASLAAVFRQSGNVNRSITLFKDVLLRQKAKRGNDHPDTLRTMHGLALAYAAARRFELAIPLLQETARRGKAVFGANDPRRLESMKDLAGAYLFVRQPAKAMPLYEETLQRQKATLGADHTDTLKTTNLLAAAYWRLKRLDKSVPLLEETLRVQSAKFGRDSFQTLLTIATLGIHYKDAGRLNEALPLLEEAHRATGKYPIMRWVAAQLLDGYSKSGKVKETLALAKQQVAEIRKIQPKNSPRAAGEFARIGFAVLQVKAYSEAETLLGECLSIRLKTEPSSWLTFNTQSMVGESLAGQKKFADAERRLLKGYRGMKQHEKKIPASIRAARLAEAVNRLVSLYQHWGKPAEVANWKKQLDTLRPSKPRLPIKATRPK